MATSLAAEIGDYIKASPPMKNGPAAGRVFHTSQGGLVTSYQLTQWTQRAARRAGMRRVSFHDLRHAYASILITSGADVKVVQHNLGHAGASMTLDIYAHLFSSNDDAVAATLDGIIQEAIPARRKSLPG